MTQPEFSGACPDKCKTLTGLKDSKTKLTNRLFSARISHDKKRQKGGVSKHAASYLYWW